MAIRKKEIILRTQKRKLKKNKEEKKIFSSFYFCDIITQLLIIIKDKEMKKTFLIFLTSFALLFLIFNNIQAQETRCDESNNGTTGIVPCNIVKISNGPFVCQCKIYHFFILIDNVYSFIIWKIATPLAVLMLTIGGVFILISAGNPNLANLGKKIVWVTIIGLALVFCAWVIVNFILTAMGYQW